MKKTGWILAAALILGLLLAGLTGYLLWHTSHNRYVKVEALAGGEDGGNENGAGKPHGGSVSGTTEEKDGHGQDGMAGDTDGQNGTDGGEGDSGQNASGQGQVIEITGGSTEDGSGTRDGEDTPVRLVFAGDVLLSDHVLKAYNGAGSMSGVVDQTLRDVIDRGDIFMVNEEFPFSDRGTAAADKQYTFRLPPEKVSLFNELGIDIVTLANNHALDFGTEALLDTCSTLDEAGIYRVGAGANLEEAKKPVITEVRGKKIGFLGASRVIPVGSWNASSVNPGMLTTYDPAVLLGEIRNLRNECDFVVVYVHWGIERDERPQDYQRNLGRQYIDAGADIVIGSHPHVLQGLEYYKGKPIVYSLGNFIFGSSIPRTALLTVEWDGENTVLGLVPGTSSAGYTRALKDEGEKKSFANYMTSISYGVTVEEDGAVAAD